MSSDAKPSDDKPSDRRVRNALGEAERHFPFGQHPIDDTMTRGGKFFANDLVMDLRYHYEPRPVRRRREMDKIKDSQAMPPPSDVPEKVKPGNAVRPSRMPSGYLLETFG